MTDLDKLTNILEELNIEYDTVFMDNITMLFIKDIWSEEAEIHFNIDGSKR